MSMNFSREQSLLRQRLQAAGSPEAAQKQRDELGGEGVHLGAPAAEVTAATRDLAAAYPAMGRAQMTAFVRTLWQTKIHELRTVGALLLAEREALLEAADLPFLEGLLGSCDVDALIAPFAGDVIGPLVTRNKKLWRELRRWAAGTSVRLQTGAVCACRHPLLDDETAFERFAELATPLLAAGNVQVLAAVDQVLGAIAERHADAVQAFATQHGRTVKLPKKKAKQAAPKAKPVEPAVVKAAPKKKAAKAASKPAAAKRAKSAKR